jgi:phospholipid transport system substrate-binding protein
MKKTPLLLLLVLCGLLVGTVWAGEESPTATLRPVLNDLTTVLLDENLKGPRHFVERREKIMSLIKRVFDFREMSKRVLGRTWREIDDKEQDNFTAQMTKLLENVYLGKLEGYSGQVIEFAGETVKGDRAQVTTLIENGTAKIPLHYIMNKTASGWMVYDINIEGVSLVRNYQEQFKSILRQDGYKGLVKILEEKNQSFLQEAQ